MGTAGQVVGAGLSEEVTSEWMLSEPRADVGEGGASLCTVSTEVLRPERVGAPVLSSRGNVLGPELPSAQSLWVDCEQDGLQDPRRVQ